MGFFRKKKEDIPAEGLPSEEFKPDFPEFNAPADINPNRDIELVLSKLELIERKIDDIERKVEFIEKVAKENQ